MSESSWRGFLTLLLTSRMLHETTLWDADNPDNLVYVAVAFLPLVFRFHWLSVIVALGVNIFSAADEFPHPPNHSLLALFLTVVALLSYLRSKLGRGDFEALPGLCAAALALVYFWAGFHKLNTDFFSEEYSCLATFSGLIAESVGVTGFPEIEQPWLVLLAAGVILLELGAGVLLFIRGYAWLGVLFALLLHAPLSFSGFYNFASVAFAVLYLLVEPRRYAGETSARRVGVDLAVIRYAVINAAGALVGLATTLSSMDFPVERVTGARAALLLVTTADLFWPFLRTPLRFASNVRVVVRAASARVAVAALALWGASSYLGLSTAANFSMFSNLRTEGPRSNHLLFGSNPLKVFSLQEDLVQIVEVGDSLLGRDVDFQVPRYEGADLVYDSVNLAQFRYLVREYVERYELEQLPMTLRYRGQTRHFDDVLSDEFFAPVSVPLSSLLLTFRTVDTAPGQRCRW